MSRRLAAALVALTCAVMGACGNEEEAIVDEVDEIADDLTVDDLPDGAASINPNAPVDPAEVAPRADSDEAAVVRNETCWEPSQLGLQPTQVIVIETGLPVDTIVSGAWTITGRTDAGAVTERSVVVDAMTDNSGTAAFAIELETSELSGQLVDLVDDDEFFLDPGNDADFKRTPAEDAPCGEVDVAQ